MSERIDASAVRYRDKVWWLYWPCRHGHVIHMIAQALGTPGERGLPDEERMVQGFRTDAGRFVDRIEGAALAIANGQVTALKWPPELYSEDLW